MEKMKEERLAITVISEGENGVNKSGKNISHNKKHIKMNILDIMKNSALFNFPYFTVIDQELSETKFHRRFSLLQTIIASYPSQQ